jgi:hypothetical protein
MSFFIINPTFRVYYVNFYFLLIITICYNKKPPKYLIYSP